MRIGVPPGSIYLLRDEYGFRQVRVHFGAITVRLGSGYPSRGDKGVLHSGEEPAVSLREEGTIAVRSENKIAAAYAEHSAAVFRFARRSLRDEGAAQDAVQETFLRAWRSA